MQRRCVVPWERRVGTDACLRMALHYGEVETPDLRVLRYRLEFEANGRNRHAPSPMALFRDEWGRFVAGSLTCIAWVA